MIAVYLLFVMLCSDSYSPNCRTHHGGYFATKEACERVKPRYMTATSDAQCVKRRSDPS